jgi:sortase A
MWTWFQGVRERKAARLARVRISLASTVSEKLRRQLAVFLICLGVTLSLLAASTYAWIYLEQQHLLAQSQSTRLVSSTHQAESGPVLLYIPKIQLRAAVLDGTDAKSLLLAPGHLKDTAWPGDPGNAVLAGHRDSFFRHLHELARGDDIYVHRNGQEFHYIVWRKLIVSPADVSLISPTPGHRLTLITCYPTYFVGPAPKRLVVIANLDSQTSPPGVSRSAM